MRNKGTALVAIGLILLVGCVACAPKGPPRITEAKDILGTWEGVDSEGYSVWHVKFREDGTARYSDNMASLEDVGGINIAAWTEEFWFDDGLYHGRIIKQTYSGLSEVCKTAIGVYEVHLLEDGSLAPTVVEDECQIRVDDYPDRYEPVE